MRAQIALGRTEPGLQQGMIRLLAGIYNKMALVWIECGQGLEYAIHGSLRTRFKLQRTTVTSLWIMW